MNKPPDSLDSEHQTLWGEIKEARNSQAKMWTLVIPVVISALGALLALSLHMSEKLSKHMEEGAKLGASIEAHTKALDRDLQDKYDRHMPVHEHLEQRIDRLEDKRAW